MTQRTLIIICLIIGSGFATSWIIEEGEQTSEPAAMAKNDPDLYMVNPRITQFSSGGSPQHEINAERMTHFPLTDVTTLKVPNLVLYSEAGSAPPWDIVALNGRLLPQSPLREEVVELWDRVFANREREDGNFINIQTESLTVYPGKDYVETREKVSINNVNSTTTAGGGMNANLEAGEFEFFSSANERVRTVLTPHYRSGES